MRAQRKRKRSIDDAVEQVRPLIPPEHRLRLRGLIRKDLRHTQIVAILEALRRPHLSDDLPYLATAARRAGEKALQQEGKHWRRRTLEILNEETDEGINPLDVVEDGPNPETAVILREQLEGMDPQFLLLWASDDTVEEVGVFLGLSRRETQARFRHALNVLQHIAVAEGYDPPRPRRAKG